MRKQEWALLKNFFNQWLVWTFEYLNKITLKYYSCSYLCYFRRTNIFGYSFGKCVVSEYIRIFVRYMTWHLNIFGYSFVSILWYSLITGTVSLSEILLVDCVRFWNITGSQSHFLKSYWWTVYFSEILPLVNVSFWDIIGGQCHC